ncbi:uncharacterized protein LOC112593925 isoform X2 [Melanaphis sacchari]|nr:uncharacterized protein LOC112593925 isoform X2 [Melanaphis sacchari]
MDSIKRIHLLEKKDIHNIKRDFNISYSTKKHQNDAISVDLWVKEMMKKGDESPVLYYKQQGINDNCVPCFTKNDFCLVIMTQFQSELLLKFGKDKVCLDGTHGLNGYNFQLYTVVVVDEYGNGYPVAFCFSNRSDTTVYRHFFQCIKKITGNINANIFMFDDEPAGKQLLCTWHVLRNWAKNLRKIHSNEKQNIVFKTLKALLYETDENNFLIELQHVLDDLLNDEDTRDFGNYFKTTYSYRAEKWAYFNRKYVGINTNMYLEALHKSIKYCYLEGKSCKRLDLSINALMSLVRDKSFERIIKISKQKMSSKLTQIIAAHNKSEKITPDMVVQVDGNWLVNSEADIHIQYRVEKTTLSCDDCVLRCNVCRICVHTYKCTCMNNVIYFNICKHIHACAKRQTIITDIETVQNENQSFPSPCDLAVDNGFLREQGQEQLLNKNIKKNNEEIKHKLEMILGIHSRANMNEEDQMYIIKQCDNILTTLGKEIDFKKTSNLQLAKKRKIEPQARFFSKKKVPSQHPTLSSIEGTQIRESLKNSTDVLNISTTPMFDHSYL